MYFTFGINKSIQIIYLSSNVRHFEELVVLAIEQEKTFSDYINNGKNYNLLWNRNTNSNNK